MARKFLYGVAILVMLAIGSVFAYRMFGAEILRWSMVPSTRFTAQPAAAPDAYADEGMWLARPDIRNNPARWTPPGMGVPQTAPAAVFFIHPTSYLRKNQWNAPLDDQEANGRAELFLRGQASAFNAMGDVWAPRYRQATFGAFLTTADDAQRALDLAYADVLRAFDSFLSQVDPNRPIVLAGHSQGALHLTRLLKDRVAGTPLARRIVAAYVVGWPVSRTADLPALGLPECAAADQAGCILSWQSFAEPAEPKLITDTFDATTGFTGASRRGTPLVCTNPITGTPNAAAPASANLGTLFPDANLTTATLEPGRVGARCDSRGFLLIGTNPPELGGYVLPGNNYHVYDYSLFWGSVRADAARRLKAWQAR
ncbi:DUF3089 domain-containing protein [Sphingomonas sp. ac-8]|uniref:DUF3089 domain-containing protein n=1 Tax=Sphingomonas sp. ac-8 TaxID=3242977 RepID=UPI003A8081F3